MEREFLVRDHRDAECGYFCLVLLDNRHRLIDYFAFRGTTYGASVHLR